MDEANLECISSVSSLLSFLIIQLSRIKLWLLLKPDNQCSKLLKDTKMFVLFGFFSTHLSSVLLQSVSFISP